MRKQTSLTVIQTFTLGVSMTCLTIVLLLSGCQSEAEKQKEAQQDAKHAFLEKFGFEGKVPEELLGRWVSVRYPDLSFVIEAKGDSVVKKNYVAGHKRGYEECGGCKTIEGMFYDATHQAAYVPELFPQSTFGFIENDSTRWNDEILKFNVKGDTMTFHVIDRNFQQYPNAPMLVYTRKPQ